MTISERIQGEIAEEKGVNKPKVTEAITAMYKYLVSHMESGDLTPIRIQYMGLWQCKPYRVMKLKEKGLL